MATSSLLSQEQLDQLPKESFWDCRVLYQWEGFWYRSELLKGLLAFQSHFDSRSDDIILASSMKTGTTWLKALCICIMGCQTKDSEDLGGDEDDDYLQVKNPHEYVRSLEYAFSVPDLQYCLDYLSGMQSPRLLHTHLPYSALTNSIKNSDGKIIYLVRNPKDTLVSSWHFFNKTYQPNQEPYPFSKAYDTFCKGVHPFGPFLDHALEYWSESLKMPSKILFLKYEDLKRDPNREVKRLASFLGRPFDNEEEVEKVIWRSSMDRLKNLDVNKDGVLGGSWVSIPNSSFFRLGVVGDWRNHFTDEMKQDLDEIIRKKLEGSGLDIEA